MNFVRQVEWREILHRLVPGEGENILDAACGYGLLSVKIARTGADVSGIDISMDALRAAALTSNVLRVFCGLSRQDAHSLAFPTNTFDKVVSSSALEHFGRDDIALSELERVLKPGGVLVLTCDSLLLPMDEKIKELHRRTARVVNYYTKGEAVTKLERAGFDVIRAEYILKTRLTNAFYQLGIKLRWIGLLWIGVSFLATPICLLSEATCGDREHGQTVIVQARKRGFAR